MAAFDEQHTQRVLRSLHDRGIEMTPSEVIAERKEAFKALRRSLRGRGYFVPDSDEDLFRLVVAALLKKENTTTEGT